MYSKLKTVATDTAFYGAFNIIGRFLSFLLTPVYTNFLAPSDFGNVVYVFSVIAFVNILCTLSLDTAFFRFYKQDETKDSGMVFSLSFWMILAASLIVTVLFMGCSRYYSDSEPLLSEMFFYGAFLPLLDSVIMLPYCVLRAERKLKRFSYTRVTVIFISVTLTIVFLKYFNMGGKAVFIAHLIGSLIGFASFIPMLIEKVKFKIDKVLLKELLVFSLPSLPASFSVILLQFGDQFLLKNMVSSTDLAMYSANYKLALPMMMFVTMFDYAWKPYYMSHFKDEDSKDFFSKVMTYFVLVCSMVFLFCIFFMRYIVALPLFGGSFYNPVYWPGIDIVVPFVLLGYFFNGLYNNLGLGINITKKTKYFPISVGIAAVVNFVSNIILIPICGFKAAAWSTAWSYLISAAALYIFVSKVYPMKYEYGRIIKITTASAIMAILFFILQSRFDSFLLPLGLILLYPILLAVTGFFNRNELIRLQKIFR